MVRRKRLGFLKKSLMAGALLIAMTSSFTAFVLEAATVDVESLLADLNRKPPVDRVKVLTEGAKREGVVYYYGSTTVNDNQELVNGFNGHYPFVEVRYTRLGGASIANKLINEYRGGIFNADVITMRGTFIPELVNKKVICRYKGPMMPFLRKGFADTEGYLSSLYATGYTVIFNPSRVKPAEVPKAYKDLLHPRWKGRIVMDSEDYDWFAGMIDLMGENGATSLLRRLVTEQAMELRRNHTLVTQLVAAGEHDLLIDGYVHEAVGYKTQGAPIELVFMNPTIVKPPNAIAITSKAPHPHAAALLVDYYLSKEAHEIMAHKQSRWTTRADVKWMTEPGTDIHAVSSFEWGRRYNQLIELFKKVTANT